MLRGFPFLRFEITRHVVSGRGSAGDGHEHVLQVGKREAFERPEHPVLVNGLERHCHVFKFSGSRWRESREEIAALVQRRTYHPLPGHSPVDLNV
jgi:hypothetical protein